MKKALSLITGAVISIGALTTTLAPSMFTGAAERTGFVTTNGTQFMLDGSSFYYAGTNNYYINFKSKFATDNVIEDAAAMGLKVIRTWGNIDAGVKTDQVDASGAPVFQNSVDGAGHKDGVYYQYFDKTLNRPVVNEGADGLQVLDYAIYKASQEDVKLLITFTNNWEAFGGKQQYVKWAKEAGITIDSTLAKPEDAFFTNETIKGWYKDYVKTLLNHENVYTGVKYKDDPTIFSWELMNEPRCQSDENSKNGIFVDWATEMSNYVKSIDSNHMLAAGDEGFYSYTRSEHPELPSGQWMYFGSEGMDFNSILEIPNIDYGTVHIYCDQWGISDAEDADRWFIEHAESAAIANKPVIMEEFGWAQKSSRAAKYIDWFSIFEGIKYAGTEFAGTNYWMIASEMDDNKLYTDYDGYTVYYRGSSSGEANPTAEACQTIIDHAARMNAKNSLNSITPKKISFDIVNPVDVTFECNMVKGTPNGVTLNSTKLSSSDYIISGNTVTIKSSVVAALGLGVHKVVINTTDGNEPTAVLELFDSNVAKEELKTVDTFEKYASSADLAAAYIANSSGAPVTVSLSTDVVKNGKYSMKYEYDVESNSYCGVTKKLTNADWTNFDGISFWIYSDGSNRETTIQFIDGAGAYWESIQKVTAGTGWQEVKIPFTDFNLQSWGTAATSVTKKGVKEISIYAGTNGNSGKGVWYFDDILLYSDEASIPPAVNGSSSADFNKNSPASVMFTINGNGNQFVSLTDSNGNALVSGTDYAVNGSQYRINESYLSSLDAGSYTFTANFSSNFKLTLTVNITGTIISNFVAGDANCDGDVDMGDAVAILKYLADPVGCALTEQGKDNADVNFRGNKIDSSDALAIQKLRAKQIDSLPESYYNAN